MWAVSFELKQKRGFILRRRDIIAVSLPTSPLETLSVAVDKYSTVEAASGIVVTAMMSLRRRINPRFCFNSNETSHVIRIY